jgi:hypothetical protein
VPHGDGYVSSIHSST